MHKNSAATLIAFAVVATGGTAIAAGGDSAGAAGDQQRCGPESFNIIAQEEPAPEQRVVEIDFVAKPGVSCELNGPLTELTFYAPDGERITVPTRYEEGEGPVRVDATHPAFAYLALPHSDAPQPATSASFVVPINGEDAVVSIPWNRGVSGTVEVSPLGGTG